ncbi:unnamed protein product [Lactuca saligna]|uniref:Uncharacterized protein n=1 Tax=Lactuca saligna TaxID=75948 RepID=A0AA35YF52_LACSI|nr:unnamed protein product [Lactuca saligna]
MHKPVETRDSLLIVSVRQYLADKIKPVFSMLNKIEGVSDRDDLPKQGRDNKDQTKKMTSEPIGENEQKPNSNPKDQKDNKASGSKGKEKVIDDDEEEEEGLSKGEKLIRKKCNMELDNLLNLRQELEAKEAEAEIAKVTLATQKSLFPPWTLERIQKEAGDDPTTHWLEPSVSFELDNIVDSQLDFLITPRAFLFICSEKIEKAPLSDYDVNHTLFSFYLKYGKPQFQTWSLHKIVVVKVYALIM